MLGKLFKNKSNYLFSDPENTACMVCSHVIDNDAAILHVTHDEDDGMWQFLCGESNHETSQAKIIALGEAVSIDPSINELHEIPLGVGATRQSKGKEWKLFNI